MLDANSSASFRYDKNKPSQHDSDIEEVDIAGSEEALLEDKKANKRRRILRKVIDDEANENSDEEDRVSIV